MIKKRIESIALSAMFMVNSNVPAYVPTPPLINMDEMTYSTSVQPRIYWYGTAVLKRGGWYNITSSNNIFPDNPRVHSDAGNVGDVQIRVVDGNGQIIGNTQTLKPGTAILLDTIPASSGTYTIQGRAEISDTYIFFVT